MANGSIKIESPEDHIFWTDIRTAFDQVFTHNDREVKVTRGSKEATVKHSKEHPEFILVMIKEITPPQPILVKP